MKKIMIIEDTEKIRTELKEFLSRYGYDVVAPIGFSTILSDIEKSSAFMPSDILSHNGISLFGYKNIVKGK